MTAEAAPECALSGRVVTWVPREAWINEEPIECRTDAGGCGHQVRIRTRNNDLPYQARIQPHRTDGSPCRSGHLERNPA